MPAIATSKNLNQKHDLYRQHAVDYVARRDPAIVNIARCQYLAMDGSGTPGGAEFEACIRALYAVAYRLKMAQKLAGLDYTICKLEGLWRDARTWTLLIRTPDFINCHHLVEAVAKPACKCKAPGMEAVRLLPLHEGWCVQALHVGPYCEEPATIASMCECASLSGMEFHGTLHEIYLSDPRRVPPEKMKTILRQPVRDR